MKTIFIFLLFVSTVAFAQSDKNNLIFVSGGTGIPVGSFADASGGCAASGFVGDFMYQHKKSNRKTQGFILGFRYQNSPMDQSKAASIFPGTINSVTSWTAATIFYGANWELKMSEKAFFEPRILLGVMFANTPAINTSAGNVESASGTALAYQFGFKFRFDVSDNVSILLGSDFTTASPKFTNNVGGGSVSTSQAISTINLTGGIGYRF